MTSKPVWRSAALEYKRSSGGQVNPKRRVQDIVRLQTTATGRRGDCCCCCCCLRQHGAWSWRKVTHESWHCSVSRWIEVLHAAREDALFLCFFFFLDMRNRWGLHNIFDDLTNHAPPRSLRSNYQLLLISIPPSGLKSRAGVFQSLDQCCGKNSPFILG